MWRSLRARLDAHAVLGVLVFWLIVAGLLAVAWWWTRRREGPQLAAAALPAFAAGLLVFYAWFGVGWYFTRYLAPVACVVALMLGVLVARVARMPGVSRRPALLGLAVVAVIPVVAAIRADWHDLRATSGSASAFDSVTGYRDAALVVATTPPPGSVLGERRVRLLRERTHHRGQPRRCGEPRCRRRRA